MTVARIIALLVALTVGAANAQAGMAQAASAIWNWQENLDEAVSQLELGATAFEQLNKALTGLPNGGKFDPKTLPAEWQRLGTRLLTINRSVAKSPLLPTVNTDQYVVDLDAVMDCRRQDKAMKIFDQLDKDLQAAVRVGVQRVNTLDETEVTLLRMDAALDKLERATAAASSAYAVIERTTFNRYAQSWLSITTELRPAVLASLGNVRQVRTRVDRDLDKLRQRSNFLSQNLVELRAGTCLITATFDATCFISHYQKTFPARVTFSDSSLMTEIGPITVPAADGKPQQMLLHGEGKELRVSRTGDFSAVEPEGQITGSFAIPAFDGFNYTGVFDEGGTVRCFGRQ